MEIKPENQGKWLENIDKDQNIEGLENILKAIKNGARKRFFISQVIQGTIEGIRYNSITGKLEFTAGNKKILTDVTDAGAHTFTVPANRRYKVLFLSSSNTTRGIQITLSGTIAGTPITYFTDLVALGGARGESEEGKKKKYKRHTKYTRSKAERDHEVLLAMIDLYKGPNGFDMMLLTGAGVGYGVSSIFSLIQSATEKISQLPEDQQKKVKEDLTKKIESGLKSYFAFTFGGVGGLVAKTSYEKFFGKGDGTSDNSVSGIMGGIFGSASNPPESFAQLCVMLLIFRAVFGTGGVAELLKGIGEIVPL